MGMRVDFENLMVVGMSMGMTFENSYGCRYTSIRPIPGLCPSLGLKWQVQNGRTMTMLEDQWCINDKLQLCQSMDKPNGITDSY